MDTVYIFKFSIWLILDSLKFSWTFFSIVIKKTIVRFVLELKWKNNANFFTTVCPKRISYNFSKLAESKDNINDRERQSAYTYSYHQLKRPSKVEI